MQACSEQVDAHVLVTFKVSNGNERRELNPSQIDVFRESGSRGLYPLRECEKTFEESAKSVIRAVHKELRARDRRRERNGSFSDVILFRHCDQNRM